MADSKLRLQIVTALDAAGIKATKDQIDGLEKSLTKLNRSGGGGGGGSGGPFGKWGNDLERVMGNVTKVLAVARMIGSVMNETLSNVIVEGKDFGEALEEGVKGGLTKAFSSGLKMVGVDLDGMLEKYKQKLNEQVKQIGDRVQEYQKRNAEEMKEELQGQKAAHDKILQSIQRETQEYQNQLSLVKQIHGEQNAIENSYLERLKFEDVQQLKKQGGTDEQIQQLEKAWDVRIAMDEGKKRLDSINLEQAAWAKQGEGYALSLKEMDRRIKEIEGKRDARKSQLEDWKGTKEQYQNNKESKQLYNSAVKELNQYIKDFDKELEPLYAERQKLKNEIETHGLKGLTFDMRRANEVERANLQVDKLAEQYDQHLDQMFDPLQDVVLNKQWGDFLLKSSQDSFEALKQTRDNTANLNDKLDELLQVKQ